MNIKLAESFQNQIYVYAEENKKNGHKDRFFRNLSLEKERLARSSTRNRNQTQ